MSKKAKIILFSIIGAVSLIIIGVVITIIIILATNKPKPVKFDGDTEETTDVIIIDNEDDIKEIGEYDAKEVLGISLGKITQAKSFEVITTGKTEAQSPFLTSNVKINNHRIVIDGEAFIECVSKETYDLGTRGSQRLLSGGKVAMRTTNKVDSNAVATFDNDDVEIISNDEYIKRYGWLPYQMNGYIINENTYLEDPTIKKNDDETYTILVKLDPNSDAAFYYKREIATNANATKEPVFKEIQFEIKIDSNFVIQEVKTHEKYEVTINMFIEITSPTTTECVDTYNYENVSFDENLYNYYKNKLAA